MTRSRWEVELGVGIGDVELGLPRAEIDQRLRDTGFETDVDDDDPTFAYVEEMEMVLTFAESAPHALVQIAVADDQVRFGAQPVVGRRIHEITELLHVRESETVWRTDDDPESSLPTWPQHPLSSATSEELLSSGTLWIQPLGLGLRMDGGAVREVYLRQPADMPREGVGPLTATQLELSRREDLPRYLRSVHQAGQKSWSRMITAACMFGLIGLVVWKAAEYQRRWHQAPSVEAEVIAVRPVEPDTIPTHFVVAYRDQNGVEHRAELGLADVYVPKAVGEKVEVRFLPEAPDQPIGPSRVRDVAFIKFFPWVIGIFACYLVMQVAEAILRRLSKPPREPAPG